MITLKRHNEVPESRGTACAIHYKRGDIIFLQGDKADHWYEVDSGIVRTCHLHFDGHRQLSGFFYPGDVFGIEFGAYKASAEAVTDVTLWRFGSDAPELSPSSSNAEDPLRRALTSAQDCIFLLGHRTALERVAAFLLATARRMDGASGIEIPMSRSDIADHLGLTMHTVSRTISELARRRLIGLDGPQNVRILNLASLQQLAGEESRRPGHVPSGNPQEEALAE